MDINIGFALLLTTLAGLSTGIGSLIALFIRKPNTSYLSFLLGISAGVMVYISFTELLGTAIDDVGLLKANIAFFVGIAFFALIDILVPHSYEEEHAEDHSFDLLGNKKKKAPSMSALKRGEGYLLHWVLPFTTSQRGLLPFRQLLRGIFRWVL